MSENKPKLFAKLALILGLVESVAEDARNEFQKYNYASDEAIFRAVRKHMSDNKVAIIPLVKSIDLIEDKVRVTYEFIIVDGDSGESFATIWAGESFCKDDKGINKCATAAMKYFLKTMFLIPTGKADDDPDSGKPNEQRQNRQQPPPGEPPQPPANGTRPELRPREIPPARVASATPEELYIHLANLARVSVAQEGLASDKARAKMFAIWSEFKHNDAVLSAICKGAFPSIKSRADMTMKQVDAVIKWMGGNQNNVVTTEIVMVQAMLAPAEA